MDRQLNVFLSALGTEQVSENSLKLDEMSGSEIARCMNSADKTVADIVGEATGSIGQAIDRIAPRMLAGGRLIYTGAGTSGRLGVLDASECPPTFGVEPTLVYGIIAGGDTALRNAVEGAEDNEAQGGADLEKLHINANDTVVAISASGYAPYCIGALKYAKKQGALTVSLSCNRGARLSTYADIAIETPTGAEMLAGSTRLKAGTATKMVLNMLSTGVMVRTGRVFGNLMVDMCVSNRKLKDRAVRILSRATGLSEADSEQRLTEAGGHVKTAIVMEKGGLSRKEAEDALSAAGGWVRRALREARA